MKSILLYSSKHGATKEVAETLVKEFKGMEFVEASLFKGDIHQYELLIIGSPIYVGKIDKDCLGLLRQIDTTKTKVIIFLLGLDKSKWQESLQQNIDIKFYYSCFISGKLNFPDMGFMEKTMIKMINKEAKLIDHIDTKKKYDFIDEEEIDMLRKEIQKYYK